MQNLQTDPVTNSRRHDELSDAWDLNFFEASLAVSTGVNLLLVGSDEEVGQLIGDLGPDLDGPTTVWEPGRPLLLPDPTGPGTLILRHVGQMNSHDQQRVFDWLPVHGRRLRIISTTSDALAPLIARGAFHEMLYYRLNVVCVEFDG
jgi:hypothetical protein